MSSRLTVAVSLLIVTILTAGAVEFVCRRVDGMIPVEDDPTVVAAAEPNKAAAGADRQTTAPPAKRTASVKEDYSVVIKRALFGTVPPPPPPPPPKVVDKPPEPLKETSLDLILRGTVSGADNSQRAIIQNKKKNDQDIYYKGDAIGSAIIKHVGRGIVILTVNGKDEILRMEDPKNKNTAAGANTDMSVTNPPGGPPPDNVVSSIEKAMAERKEEKKNKRHPVSIRRRLTFKSSAASPVTE